MPFITFVIYTSIYIGLIATTFYIITFLADKKVKREFYSDDELPGVTVLIPAFNEEKTISITLDSILESVYPKEKLEIIVIDDGSKDKTTEIANKYRKKKVIVLTKKVNAGKGSALNLGIKKSSNPIIFTMDADTTVDKNSLINMTRYFKDPTIMSVTPSIVTRDPKNLIQRVQHIEYMTGLFLRKTFAALNAIHITPGAFSAYRKSFFEKHGYYDENNVTEDLELALRIQYHKYKIENCAEAPAFTIAPNKFSHLLKQRRRWYVGLMKNVWKYKKLFRNEYGDLGFFVLPIAWISIFFSVFITVYLFIKIFIDVNKEILFYKSINFDFANYFNFNLFILERIFIHIVTNTAILFLFVFIIIISIYLFYASKKIGKKDNLWMNLPLFFIFFAMFFGFWWIISIIYVLFNKDISWK